MIRVNILCLMLARVLSPAWGATPAMVADFEQGSLLPSVWVVNIPNENASVRLSADQPHDGKQCLRLHYHFLSTGNLQYLGVENKVRIQAPVHQLRFWLKGDSMNCSYGVRLSDSGGKTHQYSKNTGQGGIIDFAGWKEVVVDLDSGHETWGGDKSSTVEYPITAITFCISQPKDKGELVGVEGDLSFDSLSVQSEKSVAETPGRQIAVVSPEYCSEIQGDTAITLSAPGFESVTVKCWKQGPGFGTDSTVASVFLDANGKGSFVFPGEAYPHGPITVRISGSVGDFKDNCYLQLYNKGGVSWNEGMPKNPPSAADGMALVFADDFAGPLPLSRAPIPKRLTMTTSRRTARRIFSAHTFSGHDSPRNPFSQVE